MDRNLKYKMISATLAFLLWASWAYFVNSTSTPALRFISSITQGVASFIITLIMVKAVTWIYHNLSKKNRFLLFLPALMTVCVTGSFLMLIHNVVGTEHIFSTISPALTVAFVYCLFTTYQLHRGKL